MARLTVFHTSDLHNKLTPELAQCLHQLKADAIASGRNASPEASGVGCLMLDSGDAIWSGNIYWRPGGEPVLDLMNPVPYDALCMGNREYHFLSAGLITKTARASFPVLSANLRVAKTGVSTSYVKPFVTFQQDRKRITVVGFSVPCITERMLVKKVSDYFFEQPIKAAAEIVPTLREECDLLIALTHIGLKQDLDMSAQVLGIDLILGGHTHTIAEERVGDTFIFHSGFYAHYVRKLEIEFGDGKPQVQSELIPLGKA